MKARIDTKYILIFEIYAKNRSIKKNNEAYLLKGEIDASELVKQLL
jgi:hypothetical protein